MSLETKIMDRLKEAMKAKDDVALRTLRSIKSAILLEKTSEGFSGEIDARGEITLLQKLAKQRKESISIFKEKGREDLASAEEAELAILQQFLPQELTDEELAEVVRQAIEQTGAASVRDMGKVMAWTQNQVEGRADGKRISDKVKQLLLN